jgi:hypothetical protein
MPIAVLDTLRIELPPTKTYQRRECVWVPGSDGADGRDGTLTVNLQKGRRSGAKLESDTYAVEHQGGPVFLVVKLTGDNAGEVYGVSLHPTHDLSSCTCDAGNFCVGNCKHRDALKALVEYGEFDAALPAPPNTDDF